MKFGNSIGQLCPLSSHHSHIYVSSTIKFVCVILFCSIVQLSRKSKICLTIILVCPTIILVCLTIISLWPTIILIISKGRQSNDYGSGCCIIYSVYSAASHYHNILPQILLTACDLFRCMPSHIFIFPLKVVKPTTCLFSSRPFFSQAVWIIATFWVDSHIAPIVGAPFQITP